MSYFYTKFIFFIVLLIINFALSHSNNDVNRTLEAADEEKDDDAKYLITGGYVPPIHTLAKFAVSIRYRNRFGYVYNKYFGATHFCGGTILSDRLVLTAAHCLKDKENVRRIRPSDLEVVAGSPDRLRKTDHSQILAVKKVIVHDGFTVRRVLCDIGLLLLRDSIHLDGVFAQAISFPKSHTPPNTRCTVVGWGQMYEHGPNANEILYVDLILLPPETCNKYIPTFTENKICACEVTDPERDACHGDSGGPFICNETIVGVVSYGYGCATGRPAVYTDVYSFKEWILRSKSCRNTYSLIFIIILCVLKIVW